MSNESKNAFHDFIQFISNYWHFLTIIFGLMSALIYHINELNRSNERIVALIEKVDILSKNLNEIDGSVKNLDFTINDFMEKNPQLPIRMNTLEIRVLGASPLIQYTPVQKGGAGNSNKPKYKGSN